MTTTTELRQTLDAERKLGASFARYAGKWVAIRDQKVVRDADTLNGLLERIDLKKVDRIQHVAAKRFGFCFF